MYFIWYLYNNPIGVRHMDLKQLQYFVTVVEAGSISAAARKLYMTQPPLSAQMQALERELGCPLLERGARRVGLTDAGRRLYERAKTLLELEQAAREEVRACADPAGGVLRLGVVSSVAGELVPRWLTDFTRQMPGVQLRLTEANTFRLLELLRQGHIQLAIVRTPCPDEGLIRLPLADEGLVAVAPAGELSAAPVSLAALITRPLVIYRRWEPLLREQAERAGLSLRPQCVCDDARTAVQLAATGMGVAVVPASAALPGLTVTPLQNSIRSGIQVVYRPETPLSACARHFVEGLKAEKTQK